MIVYAPLHELHGTMLCKELLYGFLLRNKETQSSIKLLNLQNCIAYTVQCIKGTQHR